MSQKNACKLDFRFQIDEHKNIISKNGERGRGKERVTRKRRKTKGDKR